MNHECWTLEYYDGFEMQNNTSRTYIYIYIYICVCVCIVPGSKTPSGPVPYHYRGFTITLRHIELGRTPLDE